MISKVEQFKNLVKAGALLEEQDRFISYVQNSIFDYYRR